MNYFSLLQNKLNSFFSSTQHNFSIYGLCPDIYAHFLFENFAKEENEKFNQIIILPSAEDAEDYFSKIEQLYPGKSLLFQSINDSPYSSIVESDTNLLQRANILLKLKNKSIKFIITSIDALFLYNPPEIFWARSDFKIAKDDIISPSELEKKLSELGYFSSVSVEEPGTFSKKGEIFDIYPPNLSPIRLNYFDDLIESIHAIDQETNKTIKTSEIDSVIIGNSVGIFTQADFIKNLRTKIYQAQPSFKNKFEKRKKIFDQLSNGILFEQYPLFAHFFFTNATTLFAEALKYNFKFCVIEPLKCERNFFDEKERLFDIYEAISKDINSDCLSPEPDQFYDYTSINNLLNNSLLISEIKTNLDVSLANSVEFNLESSQGFLKRKLLEKNIFQDKELYIKSVINYFLEPSNRIDKVVIAYLHDTAKSELESLIKIHSHSDYLPAKIEFIKSTIDNGFYYDLENLLVLTEGDFFVVKKSKAKASKKVNVDLFAEQLSTLKINDYVIHANYGVGVYKGLESIDTSGSKSDYLIIEYENNDKVYVPVYKMNLIQKYAEQTQVIKIANLQSKKFETAKARARQSAKALAFDLIKLEAERKTKKAHEFSSPDHLFKEFELNFQFDETPDQLRAIEDVLEDMQKTSPMDRLVCGDVGFGKTEVAMRAAMLAILDKKQVALLVPTTILALQHYNNFKQRFSQFPVRIEFISRFKTSLEIKKTVQELSEGKIDIVVGTHALLSKDIIFKDLGLMIIDEEHRFGVAHKEQLKVLRSNVHSLTLTATPIPRTLQLAFMGLKNLSLIQTAPPKRQSIKTYIIHEDPLTLKNAIEKELQRGGQIYYVHNRVNDIEDIKTYINKLVPQAKIAIGHGQMNEKELEKIINSFYNGDYDILLATTIIESGIDIPRANTMIINRADTFGLAQLHQLRGRIGRSDRKAYAYLIIPPDKNLNDTAHKRLKALQTYAEIGSGFAIASSDLEIRGAGDILGSEQSGHIDSVGLELYMELLNEAILELKGQENFSRKDIEISTPELSYIPQKYITDSPLRLKYYKKLANCSDINQLKLLQEEIVDIFGPAPKEFNNLIVILEIRNALQGTGIISLKVSSKIANIKFDPNILQKNETLRNKVIEVFMARPKVYKITPDFSVTYTHSDLINLDYLLKFAKEIAGSLRVC